MIAQQPTTNNILNHEITPREISPEAAEIIAAYETVHGLNIPVYRKSLAIHTRISRERSNWSDATEALRRLWRGAEIAARHFAEWPRIYRPRQSDPAGTVATVLSSDGRTRHVVTRQRVFASQWHTYERWSCTCADHQHRAPARGAAPTIDAPTVNYCKHIFAAAIVEQLKTNRVIGTGGRVLKAHERQYLQDRVWGKGYDKAEETSKRQKVAVQMQRMRDRRNAQNGRYLRSQDLPEDRAAWNQMLTESEKEIDTFLSCEVEI